MHRGITQDELAVRLQMSGLEHLDRVAVAKIESQIRSVYDFEVIVLANALKVTVAELMAVGPKEMEKALPDLVRGKRG
jgi:transcriptional regulator with XRE-family HTH domain